MVEEIGAAEGGERRVEGFEEVLVDGVDEAPEGDGLSHAGLARPWRAAGSRCGQGRCCSGRWVFPDAVVELVVVVVAEPEAEGLVELE